MDSTDGQTPDSPFRRRVQPPQVFNLMECRTGHTVEMGGDSPKVLALPLHESKSGVRQQHVAHAPKLEMSNLPTIPTLPLGRLNEPRLKIQLLLPIGICFSE